MAKGPATDVEMTAAAREAAAGAKAAAAATAPPVAVKGPLRLVRTLTGHTRAVADVKISPTDANVLASASADRTVRLWRLDGGGGGGGGGGDGGASGSGGAQQQRRQQQQQQKEQQRRQGDGDTGDKQDAAEDAPPDDMSAARLEHGGGVNAVAWHPQGALLASASDDMLVRLWDAGTGALLRALPGHTHYAYCLAFDPAGRVLATGSFDETVRVWDVRSGRLLREIPAHSDPVTALSFSYDGSLLVSGSFDGLCRAWDAADGRCLRSHASSAASAPVNDVMLSRNAKYYLQATLDSTLRLVCVETGRVAKAYTGHRSEDYCCGATFVALGGDGSGGGKSGGRGGNGSGSGSGGDGGRFAVASGSEDGGWCMWDLNSRRLIQRELGSRDGGAGHAAAALCIAAHESQPLVVTGGQEPDCAVKVWAP